MAAAAEAKASTSAPDGGEGDDKAPLLTSESKLRALLRELNAMRDADPTAKALIFSQVQALQCPRAEAHALPCVNVLTKEEYPVVDFTHVSSQRS